MTRGTLPRRARVHRGAIGRAMLWTLAAFVATAGISYMTRRVIAGMRPAVAEIGYTAPDFELDEVGTAKKFRLSSMRGKPVILCFYCGCNLCRAVAVNWSDVKAKIPDVHMIAVCGDHTGYNPVTAKDFKWGTGWDWPILADVGTRVTMKYKSVDCPRCWVLDADGTIRAVNKSRMDPPEKIVAGALAAVAALKKG